MQPFDVRWEASSIFLVDLDLVRCEANAIG